MYGFFSVVLVICLAVSFSCYPQNYGPKETLYYDGTTKVEILFSLKDNSCSQGRSNKFAYDISGGLSNLSHYYVIWKLDYIDCNNRLICRTISLDIGQNSIAKESYVGAVKFEGLPEFEVVGRIVAKHYDEEGSISPINSEKQKTLLKSSDPGYISGETKINRGEQTTLFVNGGQLGDGAKWIWYKNNCGGNKLGEGNSISINLTESADIFVRAEGASNITNCATVSVSVSQLSFDPKSIKGKTNLCTGDQANLSVDGGHLGLGAEWVWYSDEKATNEIGRGVTISLSPEKNTSVYVRAEGKLNKTNLLKTEIKINEKSSDPEYIWGSTSVCEGEAVELSIEGGKLSPDASWKWSEGCFGRISSTGTKATFLPSKTTSYYAWGEGVCGSTKCISITVNVTPKSSKPVSIIVPKKVAKNKPIKLQVNGGYLGKDASWKWYAETSDYGEVIGTGEFINVKLNKRTKYLVRGEGYCNETECAEAIIIP